VMRAAEIQSRRSGNWNARINPAQLKAFCALLPGEEEILKNAARKLTLSGRAVVCVLKVARTIADLASSPRIEKDHLLEAIQYRRYGDGDYVWGGD
ncbi:MAG: ATP-binding protein, partial [Spirochaetaceae bacterium]|nr:ATP-binding protein [Spirochaetaceae bacterium]